MGSLIKPKTPQTVDYEGEEKKRKLQIQTEMAGGLARKNSKLTFSTLADILGTGTQNTGSKLGDSLSFGK